ncbi:hypothetical protein [Hymenobacter terrenus]|nr:hypothetical protein [Hymenobacter terrenus]
MKTRKKISVALAQLALLGGVLLLKAQMNSRMKFTTGMVESRMVTT